ncbi:MAG: NAD(P)-dependent oxidoreductase [Fimbriimonas sp.]|nr:NAD(P)-dependent oxidoreductase [Fimbriimonas sp.]
MPEWRDPLAEIFPPLSDHEAAVEAHRCLYCFDAPCTHACPTHIDVPKFIKKIATGNLLGSARTILESNLVGATCARVCPVQELCEGACVLNADEKPIAIGRLQRYAMDSLQTDLFSPGEPTGMKIAVVGSGPASLSCAGELARMGHAPTIFERRALPGGLSTYGIITLREPKEVAINEAQMIARLGVQMVYGVEVEDFTELLESFDAVFLGVGLGSTPELQIPGEESIEDGLAFIERSKVEREQLHVGRKVVVIGAGNTAIDCATIAKRLGAASVKMVYRRSEQEMTAYAHEYEFIKKEGVEFEFLTQPVGVISDQGQLKGLLCSKMQLGEPDSSGRRTAIKAPGSSFIIEADQIIKAIGQKKLHSDVRTVNGFIEVNEEFETSIVGIFAGGDCIRSRGTASTVMAAQDGKLAAKAIDRRLRGQ